MFLDFTGTDEVLLRTGPLTISSSLNTWTHWAMVYDMTAAVRLRLYRNGDEFPLTPNMPSALRVMPPHRLIFGAGFYFEGGLLGVRHGLQGRMSHVALYNHPLSAASVRAHYEAMRP